MALIETTHSREVVVVPERTYQRTGVIMVLAHFNPVEESISVCMLRHNSNPLKGIKHGALGLPSETTEQFRDETTEDTLMRCFREELGITNPRSMNFYRTVDDAEFEHRFNLDTGLNGDSSNALGHGLVIWTPNPAAVIRSFQIGTMEGIVDRQELSGISFQPLSAILRDDSQLSFRQAPNPKTIVSQLNASGMLMHP